MTSATADTRTASTNRPQPRPERSRRPTTAMPTGLSTCEKPPNGPGAVAHVKVHTASAVAVNHAAGRQRGDGNDPSGKTCGRNVNASPNPTVPIHSKTQAATSAHGRAPGRTTSP